MKHSIFLKLAAVALLTVIVTTGCKKTPKNVTPISGTPTRVGAGAGEVATKPNGPVTPDIGSGLPLVPSTGPKGGDLGTTIAPPPFKPITDPNEPIAAANPDTFEGMLMDRAAFAADTIHFDYDKSIVKASEVGKLKPVITALKASPHNKLLIEGHCDERGTEEYNRALGERRALAVRAQLVKAGISPDRLRTVSYGEDKPAALGHDEAAWAKNRRGELVLLKPKN